MTMFVQQVTVCNMFDMNAYFYIDDTTKHGFLIDPGAEADKLLQIIQQNNWHIETILITHGHFDHIGAVEKISKTINIPYKIHRAGKQFLADPHFNLSQYCPQNIILTQAEYFDEGDIITLKSNPETKLKVIHTPGHTPDSVIFYDQANNLAFVGDTIFKAGIGNPNFPGGNEKLLYENINRKIFALPENTVLYSGHSEATTVGAEKNPL